MREFATLRTIGGSRRQVLRSVMLEALVVGVLARSSASSSGSRSRRASTPCSPRSGSSFRVAGRCSPLARSSSAWSSASSSRCSPASGPRSKRPACRRSQPFAKVRLCRPRGSRAWAPSRLDRDARPRGPAARLRDLRRRPRDRDSPVALGFGTLLLFIGVAMNREAGRPSARRRARLARRRRSAALQARSHARTRCGTRAGRPRPRPR